MSTGDDNRRKMLGALGEVMGAQERLTKALPMESAAERAFKQIQQKDVGIRHALDEVVRNQSLARAALDDFRRPDNLSPLKTMLAEHERARTMVEQYSKRFVVPEFSEAQRLFKQIEMPGIWTAIKQFHSEDSALRKAIEAMRTPWLDMENKLQSFSGLAEIQSIGISLRRLPAFDDTVTEALRRSLGDWRERITWPDAIFSDPFARSEFYATRGFNPHLTDFPANAFEESLRIAGLGGVGPDLVEAYRGEDELADDDDDDESGFIRTNAAHDRLLRFETHMRRFIEAKLRAAWGDSWLKEGVHPDLRQKWTEKQQRALQNGEDYPLIAYADFTDYEQIIIQKSNWNTIFKVVFRRREFVIESFQRLYPIRLCTMHARIITQDDELFLHVEVKRLLRAIGISI